MLDRMETRCTGAERRGKNGTRPDIYIACYRLQSAPTQEPAKAELVSSLMGSIFIVLAAVRHCSFKVRNHTFHYRGPEIPLGPRSARTGFGAGIPSVQFPCAMMMHAGKATAKREDACRASTSLLRALGIVVNLRVRISSHDSGSG